MEITHKIHIELNMHDVSFKTSEKLWPDGNIRYAVGTLILDHEGDMHDCANTVNRIIASIRANDGKEDAFGDTVAMLVDSRRWLERATYALSIGDGKEEADIIRKEYGVKGTASESYAAIESTRTPSCDLSGETLV